LVFILLKLEGKIKLFICLVLINGEGKNILKCRNWCSFFK